MCSKVSNPRKTFTILSFLILFCILTASVKPDLKTIDSTQVNSCSIYQKPGAVEIGPAMPRAFHYGGRHAVRGLDGFLHVTWEDPTYQFHYYTHSLDTLGWYWTEPVNPMEEVGFTVEQALMAKMAIDPVTGYLYMMPFYRVNYSERYKTGITCSTDGGETWSEYLDLNDKLNRPDEEVSWGTFTISANQILHIAYAVNNTDIMYTRTDLTDNEDLSDLVFTCADGITAGDETISFDPSGVLFQGTIVLDRNNDPHVIFSYEWDYFQKSPVHTYYKSSVSAWGPVPQFLLLDSPDNIWGIPEMVFDANNRGYYFLDLDYGNFLFGTWEPPLSETDTSDFGTLNNTGLVDGIDGAVKLVNQNFPSLEIYDADNLYLPQADVDDANDVIYVVGNTNGYSSGQGGDIVVLALENATDYTGQDPVDMPWTVYRWLTYDSVGNIGADMIYNPASSHIDVFWSAAGDTSNNAWYTDASLPVSDYDALPAFISISIAADDSVINESDLITFFGAVHNNGTQILGPVPLTVSVTDTNEQVLFTDSTTAPPIIPGAVTDTVELGTWTVTGASQEFTVTFTTAYAEDSAPYNNSISTTFLTYSVEENDWPLQSDSMNLAILIVDYETYEFEGGHFSIHTPCPDCPTDSLPFIIRITPVADFGDIAFVYSQTGDTLFWGEIIWMGLGEILYPEIILPPDSFDTMPNTGTEPVAIEYFNTLTIDPDTFILKADSAWRAIKSLDITESFARDEYTMGIYLYPPSVGVFDPRPAKWILFLYQDLTRGSVSVDRDGILPENVIVHQNHPNPFNPTTTIQFDLSHKTHVTVTIYDLLGRKINTLIDEIKPAGTHRIQWDASNVASGIYFYRLSTGSFGEAGSEVFTKKMVVMK